MPTSPTPVSSECTQQQGSLPAPTPRGRLVVLTGPSGVGKGTLVNQLRQRHPELYLSVSVTTRPPRPSEQEGVNYYFRSREEFLNLIEANELLEWAQYAGNFYGTPREIVFQKLNQGQDVLLEIELAGARQVRQQYPDAIRIFLCPLLWKSWNVASASADKTQRPASSAAWSRPARNWMPKTNLTT